MLTPRITSPSNPRIKQARALSRRKERDASGLCVVEGIFHVGEALAAAEMSRAAVEYLLYAPERLVSDFGRDLVARAAAMGIPVYETAAGVLAAVADKDNPQGILAVARPRRTRLDELDAAACPWLVALIAPQDPGNVGAILHPAAVRAGMGAVFHKPIVSAPFDDFLVWARAGGYRLIATSARGRDNYRAANFAPPLALLLGSEREGLSAAQIAAGDELVRLPMHGRITSLNLAVAAGVLLYAVHDSLAAQGLLPA
jgi:TrmH family RNA methyltransferase